MPRLDFVPYTVHLHSFALLIAQVQYGIRNYAHSIYVHTHPCPYMDRFPFNSRYTEEVKTIFIIILPKRLCS